MTPSGRLTRSTGPLWLGVDLGTQQARALVVDDDGHVFGAGSAPLTSTRGAGRHEQDPRQWWAAVVDATRAALAGLPADVVAALAVTATSGSVLLVDSAGNPRTEALMYDDARAVTEAGAVDDAGAALWRSLGYTHMQPTWALPKLLWLLNRQPELVADTTRLCHQADLITARFVGRLVPTDASNALKSGYDLVRERWPDEVLTILGIPPQLLPAVVRPGTVLGRVGPDAAALTGVPAGIPVVAGMTDGCAAQLGAGCVEIGSWNSVLGTTLVLKGVSAQLIHDPAGSLYCHRGPDGTWLPGGASNCGAGVVTEWFPGADLADLTARAARLPIGPMAYPLLARGERFPFRALDAETFLLGRPHTGPGVFAALLLGVTCLERLCFDRVTMLGAPTHGTLTFTGGASRNEYWSQMRTDMLGRQVHIPEQNEPALGMAILAATSSGRSAKEAVATMVRRRGERTPNTARVSELTGHYAQFLEALTARGWLDNATATYAAARL
ncbi:carbohydrate kinase [Mycobacterium frederiksbergense]|uniref:Carbohydrate kinase n=1 Tax=Mycolicibacterium frederiksbergense TaxID=117567 RepID=A0A6H0SBA6_9MYCO|nr:FGGY family carbohydrate kinase [Mycolicibacterium frederiksbergense]MCV7043413.1 carbohydrate kinase [Mycolicibacterium frederiksbergense]QIV83861.1 carbohydrate kinase [Mycolicibacterium frederiksbergense]